MLTTSSSVAFNEGHGDAIGGHDPVFADDSAYMAGWQLGRAELIGKSFDKVEQNGMKQGEYRCPEETCGSWNTTEPDEEGLVDCCECGIWFNPLREPYQEIRNPLCKG